MNTCKICTNPRRAEIDEALVNQTPLRHISAQFGTSSSALHRHRAHIPGALVAAKDIEEAANAETLLSQVQGLVARSRGILDKAEHAGNLQTALAAIRELRGCLELLGKASGELKAGNGAIAIATAAPPEIDRGAIIEKLLGRSFVSVAASDAILGTGDIPVRS